MLITFQELKKKDVIDLATAQNLGKIVDLIINKGSGQIEKVVVTGKKNCFLSNDYIEIDYACITKIGQDSVLYKKCRPKREEDECCHNPVIDCEDE